MAFVHVRWELKLSVHSIIQDLTSLSGEVVKISQPFFSILKEMIFIASISTYVSLYYNSTTGIYIIIKECIRLNTIKKAIGFHNLNTGQNTKVGTS